MILTVIIPVTTLMVTGRRGALPEVFQEYPNPTPTPVPSPTPSPLPTPSPGCLAARVTFEGLPTNNQGLSATISTAGTSWQKQVLFNPDGTLPCFDLTGLSANSTYDFILYAHPYLTIRRTINLAQLPTMIDFGTAKTGDLNGDNQINSLDWSWMRKNFGLNGDE